jgi:hypothetical protein
MGKVEHPDRKNKPVKANIAGNIKRADVMCHSPCVRCNACFYSIRYFDYKFKVKNQEWRVNQVLSLSVGTI